MKALWRFLAGGTRIDIGPLRRADIEACAIIHAAAFHRGWGADEIAALLAEPSVAAAAATRSGALAGFVLSRRAADEAEILTIAVAKKFRGAGVGRALLDDHLATLVRLGAKQLFLEVDGGNKAALALYARAGFARVGERKAYYTAKNAPPATALILKRALA